MKSSNLKILKSFLFMGLLVVCWQLVADAALAQLPALPTSGFTGASGVVEIQAFEQIFANILTVATSLAGLAAFIMLIVGGFKWLTSGGDPKKLESAKGSITYAFAGLALLILIWFVLLFIKNFTGVDVTIFQIPL